MHDMGYTSCRANPDLWYKPMVRPTDNYAYYAYILCYVDDILSIHHDAMSVLMRINNFLPLKPSLVGNPDTYLGTTLKQTQLANGTWAWGMSPSKYVQQATLNCQAHLKKHNTGWYSLSKRTDNPFAIGYQPELDTTEPLDGKMASYYQSLIGVMCWMIKIGRVGIATEVSLLSLHLAYPQEGHFDAALHVMSYLRIHPKIFDPSDPNIEHGTFPA